MVDFHSHIIPNVDDGARNLEDTLELLSEAKIAGFDTIVLTSHYIENTYENNVEERMNCMETLQENIDRQNIDLKLYLGSEIYFSESIIHFLEEGMASSINNSNYVLFEFPLNTKPSNIYDVMYDMLEIKIIPVLAHPERYSFVQKEPELIYDLIQAGVLMQANFTSILGRYGEKAKLIVKKLFENNMIHFLGSDVHRPNTIYPKIPMAKKEIELIVGKKRFEEISSINPMLAIKNKRIDIDEPEHFKLSLKEKMLMNLK